MRGVAKRKRKSIRSVDPRPEGNRMRVFLRMLAVVVGAFVLLFTQIDGKPAGKPSDPGVPDANEEANPVQAGPRPVVPISADYRIPILMYHDIGSPGAALVVTPETFEEEMRALSTAGYEAVTMDDLLLSLHGDRLWLPEKGVAITFDDGYQGVYRWAYPVLRNLGFRATVFVVTGLIGKDDYLTWDQVRELAAEGWAVGSHAVHHVDLRTLGDSQLRTELLVSKKAILDLAGREALSFCYPSGKYNSSVVKAVKEAGYLGAVTTEPGWAKGSDAPFTLKRVRIDGRDGLQAFRAKLSIP